MSFDYRLMFALHGLAMVLFVFGSSLSVSAELTVMAGASLAAASASLVNRTRLGWRWPGAGTKQFLGAFAVMVPFAIMMFVGSQGFAPTSRTFLPWYFALTNMGIFAVLAMLRVVRLSEARFEADVTGRPADHLAPKIETPTWKRQVKFAYNIAFVAVWLEGMTALYVYETRIRSGSPTPTSTQAFPLTDHGATVYLSAQDSSLVSVFMSGFMIGIPTILAIGFALQFLLHIPVFGRNPFGLKDPDEAG
jgi:hypothetical protein